MTQEKINKLKTALFMLGIEEISNIIGYDIPEEDKDVTENRLDIYFENVNDTQLTILYNKYCLEWIDNADSYICPICRFETNNPNYHNAKCPKCGFVAFSDRQKQK